MIFSQAILKRCGDIESNPGPLDQGRSQKQIKLCQVNMRSLLADGDTTHGTTKFSEFKTFVYSNDFDIIGITETWLDGSIDNDKLYLTEYLPPIRKDRSRHGGGICVYIHNNFAAQRIPTIEPDGVEIICLEYFCRHTKNLLCITYKPPDNDTLDYLVGIDSILSNSHNYNDIIFLGDFNCKHEHFCSTDRTTANGRLLKAYFDSREFVQLVHEPTRFQQYSSSCLDLLFTNKAININNVIVYPQINNCDHCPVAVELSTQTPVIIDHTTVWFGTTNEEIMTCYAIY